MGDRLNIGRGVGSDGLFAVVFHRVFIGFAQANAVQGAAQVRACADPHIRLALVDLFVMPPSEDELHARLTARNTDAEEVIALRMKNAMEEMAHWPSYQYRLLSATREEDYTRFKALLMAERLRVSRLHQP